MKGAGPFQITLAWGLTVLMSFVCYGNVSGAHFNPAVTIGLAIAGGFEWGLVVPYIIAEVLGGITGYAINLARDAGPHIAHMIVLPKDNHNWSYGWIPVVAPIVGGIVAALFCLLVNDPLCIA